METSTATFDLVAPGEATMQRRRQTVIESGMPYLVAEGYRFTVEDSIYVRADCIGHGVGKLLLTELIAQCQKRRHHSMVACVCGINPKSIALHASVGFLTVGTLPEAGKKFGQWHSLTIMQCLLER